MKRKIFKILLIIILCVLIAFLLMFVRKIYIIEKIKNKATELERINNYYYYEEKEFDSLGEKSTTLTRYNNILISDNEHMKSIYIDNLHYTIYKDYGFYYEPYVTEGLALETKSTTPNGTLTNYFSGLSLNEKTYTLAFLVDIKSTKFEDIKCYAVSYKQENNDIYTVYINKETLLIEGRTFTSSAANETYTNHIDIELNTQKADDFILENHLSSYEKYIPETTTN